MDLSIIIPSFNTKDLLDRCLTSIYNSLQGSKLSFEVIVIDNASNDGTVGLLNKKYPRVEKIFNKINLGYGKANNLGIKKAKGNYILLLNSDIKVLDSAIETLFDFTKDHADSFVGGKLFNEDMTPQSSCGPMFSLPVVALMLFAKGDSLGLTRYSPANERSVGWVSGGCLMARKRLFIQLGLFDESIFMYMDEIDLLYRASKSGIKTYFLPTARFIHSGAASSAGRKQPVLNIYRGLLYFYRKHRSIMELNVLKSFLCLKAYAGIGIGRITGNKYLQSTYEEAIHLV